MARVPYVDRENMDEAGKVIYDRIRNDRNSPTVGLQFRALLNSPDVASHLTSMGAVLRFKSAMPENLKEFAIIVLAREWNSDIEWTAHAALAAKAGVTGALDILEGEAGFGARVPAKSSLVVAPPVFTTV